MSRIATASAWNLFGNVAPIGVAIFTIPLTINGFGAEKFGVLTLIWAFIGYFGFFDFGIGRALTHFIAIDLSRNDLASITVTIWTGIIFGLATGCAAMTGLYIAAPYLLPIVIPVDFSIQNDVSNAFVVVSLGIPIIVVAATLRGALEGYKRFDVVNKIRAPLGIWTYCCPLIGLGFEHPLAVTAIAIIVGRFAVTVLYFQKLGALVKDLHTQRMIDWATLKKILGYGGWFTVTAVIGPIIVSFDRFVISSLLTVAAVAYYTTPFEVVSRTTILASALSFAMFPSLSQLIKTDRQAAANMISLALRWLLFITTPVYAILIVYAGFILDLWLGSDFADKATRPMQLLALGVFINGLAHIPFTAVQSAGHPEWSAKLHLVELAVFAVLVYFATLKFGIIGTAAVWSVRSTLDGIIHLILSYYVLGRNMPHLWLLLNTVCLIVFFLVLSIFLTSFLHTQLAFACVVITWLLSLFYMFDAKQRHSFLTNLKQVFRIHKI